MVEQGKVLQQQDSILLRAEATGLEKQGDGLPRSITSQEKHDLYQI